VLEIEHIYKTFNGKKVVDDISVKVPQGSVAIFLGESGVGKSTLLRILAGLEQADNGIITVNGKPFDESVQRKDHLVGMVFQQFNLFTHKTVKQNITLALQKVLGNTKQQADDTAQQLLQQFGLQALADAQVSSLSGGQRQRLALARTLAMKPYIICMDEPTSALDPLLTSYVAQIIENLAKQGYIVAVATHDTILIEKIDCMIYLMKDGKIIQSARSSEYKEHPEQYQHLQQFIAGKHI
jgi:ABC-type polar amino acid transport system ATPase subunit